jgi:protein disulfide-isomerase
MKKVLLCAAFVLLPLAVVLPANPEWSVYDWYTDLEDALTAARQQDKLVMVFFAGTDWCSWCDRLILEVIETERFAGFLDDFLVPVLVDFPRSLPMSREQRDRNRQLGQEYEVRGFPTVLILDHERNEVFRTGYRRGGVTPYITHLLPYVR